MSHDRCLACGTDLHGASSCPQCALPRPMLLLDLQKSAAPTGPRPQIVHRDRRNRLGVIGAVGVVFLLIAIGVAARFSGGDGDVRRPNSRAEHNSHHHHQTTQPQPERSVVDHPRRRATADRDIA